MTASAPRQHRLMIPIIALLAIVLNVVLFLSFESKMTPDHAAYIGAAFSFLIVVAVGKLFKPHLGD